MALPSLRARLAAIGIGLCSATPAWAAPTQAELQRAREIFENGQSLYREGRYEDAMVAFEAAWKLSEKPGLLYNMASCSERLGHYQQAIDQLNRYRVYAEPGERVALERRLTNLELRLAENLEPEPPPPAPPPPPPEPTFGRTGKALLIAGGTTAVIGGGVQIFTYTRSVGWVAEGDRQTWEAWQPVNLAAGSVAAVGGTLALTGIILGANGISADTPRWAVGPGHLALRGRF